MTAVINSPPPGCFVTTATFFRCNCFALRLWAASRNFSIKHVFIRANCQANMDLSNSFACQCRSNCIALRIHSELLVIKGSRSWFIFYILVVYFFLYRSSIIPVLLFFRLYASPYFLSPLDIFQCGSWSPRDKPLDDPLKVLEDRFKTTVLSSRANGTVLAYSPAFRKWKQFALELEKLDGNAFPASPFYVALYLQHLIEEIHSPSAVDSAFYGLSGPMTWREFPTQLMIQLLRP